MKINIRYYNNGIQVNKTAILSKGKPLADRPKSYKHLASAYHNIGNAYNPHYLEILQTKSGKLIYEIYRDGCFYPYYGKLILND